MNSLARLSEALSKVRRLRQAVAPYSRTATEWLNEIERILEAERTAAIARRTEAGKQI